MADTLEEAFAPPNGIPADWSVWIDNLYVQYRDLVADHDGNPPWSRTNHDPSQVEASGFLRQFTTAVASETKKVEATALRTDRAKAIRLIRDRVESWGGAANFLGFPNINRFRFAIELALRIRRPRVIDQCRAVLCGSASVLQGFFKTDPVAAATFALDFAEQGWAMLGNKRVDPPALVRTTAAYFDESPIDFCLLAGLRYHFEPLATGIHYIVGAQAADPLRQYTKPALLVSWLREMGYSRVEDRTFGTENFNFFTSAVNAITRFPLHDSNRGRSVGLQNLGRAIQDLNQGHLVFLWAYGTLSENTRKVSKSKPPFRPAKGTPLPETTAEGFPALHWTLVRKLDVGGNQVRIRLYTWGNSREATFAQDEFLDVYLGHVMAQI